MTKKFHKLLLFLLCLLSSSVYAFNDRCSFQWVTSDIDNLKIALAKISTRSNIPVFFPSKYPVSNHNPKFLYASDTSNTGGEPIQTWQVSIDATPDCHGTKVCNIGSLTAERKLNIDRNYISLPDNQKHSKEMISLRKDKTGYYTPFHIEAGGVNPTLEWKEKGVWYTLRWRIDAEPACQKQAMIDMVNFISSKVQ